MNLDLSIDEEIREGQISDPNIHLEKQIWGIFSRAQMYRIKRYFLYYQNDYKYSFDIFILCCAIKSSDSEQDGYSISQTVVGLCKIIKLYGFNCDSIIKMVCRNKEDYSDAVFEALRSAPDFNSLMTFESEMAEKRSSRNEMFNLLVTKFGRRCSCCFESNSELCVSHIIPPKDGGNYVLNNLQLKCRGCLIKKTKFSPALLNMDTSIRH